MDAETNFCAPVDHAHTARLLLLVEAGDRQALDDLLRRYRDRVLRIARVRLGIRLARRVEADDIVQSTLERAWKSFDQFDSRDPARLIDWLAVLAENCVRDEARRWSAQRRDSRREIGQADSGLEDGASALAIVSGREATPSQEVIAHEAAEIFDRCISELPVRQREVILLRQFADMTWAQVAADLGSPSAKAAVQLHLRALEALRLKLEAAGVEPPPRDASSGVEDAGAG